MVQFGGSRVSFVTFARRSAELGQQDHQGRHYVGDRLGLARLPAEQRGEFLAVVDDDALHDPVGELLLVRVERVAGELVDEEQDPRDDVVDEVRVVLIELDLGIVERLALVVDVGQLVLVKALDLDDWCRHVRRLRTNMRHLRESEAPSVTRPTAMSVAVA